MLAGLKSKEANGHHASMRLNPVVVWLVQGQQAPGARASRVLSRAAPRTPPGLRTPPYIPSRTEYPVFEIEIANKIDIQVF
jgi:hypothetical protein